jgi:CheY-like chemotaxis protein
MGGDILAASEVGRGTRFTVTLPLARATLGEPPPEDRRRVVGLEPGQPEVHVLVVDDRRENRALLVDLLVQVGMEVREAADGAEAVERWREWRPDLVWMDMRMPVMDGFEATRRIRAVEAEEAAGDRPAPKATAIIALSASVFDHDREAVLQAGCDDFLAKPFREHEVFSMMAEYRGVRNRLEEAAPVLERSTPVRAESVLTRARLSDLPADLIASLGAALVAGDVREADAVIDRIAEQDGPLAAEMRTLVREYRFDEILEVAEAQGE